MLTGVEYSLEVKKQPIGVEGVSLVTLMIWMVVV